MLTSKAKYALRALICLAKGDRATPAHIADLAREAHAPVKFLERILLDLKRTGILQSRKGKGGGYTLGRPPNRIYVGEVVRLMDGPLAPVSCVSQTAYARCRECPDENACGIRSVMKEVRDAIAGVLDSTTLENIARRETTPSAPRKGARAAR